MIIDSKQARIFSRLGQRGAIFGLTLADAVAQDSRIIALTADLATLSGMERFASQYPGNFLNIGIAEQNMIGISAGLASEGFIPIATTYATFASLRGAEQIRHYMGYMKHKIIVIGSGAGLVQGFSGATHYATEDIALMRAIPNLIVISPSDAGCAVKAFESALKCNAPVYMRLTGGMPCPIIYKEDFDFEIGKAIELAQGDDVAILSTGTIASNAIKAAEILRNKGISSSVFDFHTIKPIDEDSIRKCLSHKLIVTIEEHNTIGGLGSAVAEIMSESDNSPSLLRLGIRDQFMTAGDYDYLIENARLTPEQIAEDIYNKLNC